LLPTSVSTASLLSKNDILNSSNIHLRSARKRKSSCSGVFFVADRAVVQPKQINDQNINC